jgi:Domain of unknown function (DUF5666)
MFIAPRNVQRRTAVMLAVALMLTACGGVDSGGTGVGQASQPTYAAGPITGFGSIIVNGVHFDESAAQVFDDQGQARSHYDLKLGMLTEVFASAVLSNAGVPSATAAEVHFGSQLIGKIDSVDVPGNRLKLLGQTVRVTTRTVFDAAAGGLAALAAGDPIEVYAQFDTSTQVYVAKRIERRTSLTLYKLQGSVSAVSSTNKTITVGGQLISYAELSPDPSPALAVGTIVRVSLRTSQVAGAWVATTLATSAARTSDRERAEVDGRISALTDSKHFVVNGITVDASTASISGASGAIVLGARVEVQGSIKSGVLVATQVKLENDDEAEGLELQGTISAPDAGNKTFVVRRVTVVYNDATRFDSSTAADIVAGRRVAVKGVLSSVGTRLLATSIHVER